MGNNNDNNLSIENIQLKFQQQNILEPIQKDKGINFIFLNQSNDAKIKDDGIIITIGNFGSFIYNKEKPLLIPPDKTLLLQPPPTPMKCKDADFVRKLTREECQEALIKYADKKCCIRKRPAEHMHVKTANTYNSFSYILTTFTEKRSLILKYSSIKPGEQLDLLVTNMNMNSIISDPLLIDCKPNEIFKTHTKYEYVPKSDTLYPCYRCNGFGCLRCSQCNGIGNMTCNKCKDLLDQTNTENNDENKRLTCDLCNAKRLIDCGSCSSKGEIICNKCNGNQWLKWYLQVKFD
jgi:hypothetical protein